MTALPAITFGHFIKHRRLSLGYKVLEMAKKSGISVASIHQYEAGVHRPTSNNLYKLATAYELTTNDLAPYDLVHVKSDKVKPIAKVHNSIRQALNTVNKTMTGESQFEQKMRLKLIDTLVRCEDILDDVRFLDDAF